MKLFKKIMIISLLVASISQILNANLPQVPSLWVRACQQVPFKATLGLGLGCLGVAAYCWNKIPGLQTQLNQESIKQSPEEPVTKDPQEISREIRECAGLNASIRNFKKEKKAETLLDQYKQFISDFEKKLNNLRLLDKQINGTHGLRAFIQSGKNISDKDEIDSFVQSLEEKCTRYKEQLDNQIGLQVVYNKNKREIDAHNARVKKEHDDLNNKITQYKTWKSRYSKSGILFLLIAGISKYFNK